MWLLTWNVGQFVQWRPYFSSSKTARIVWVVAQMTLGTRISVAHVIREHFDAEKGSRLQVVHTFADKSLPDKVSTR